VKRNKILSTLPLEFLSLAALYPVTVL